MKQFLHLLLQLVPFVLARVSRKPVIIGPMGFGPFANRWQGQLAARALSFPSQLYIREAISLGQARRAGLTHAQLAIDHGLILSPLPVTHPPKRPILGVALRNWFTPKKQQTFEENVVLAIARFAKDTGSVVQPIVQVHAPQHNENDLQVAQIIAKSLRKQGVNVRNPIILQTPTHAQTVYQELTILLGMRMHSNILAATQGVPFVAIAYEHKTLGIAQTLKMEDYCIQADGLEASKLYELLKKLYANHKTLRLSLYTRVESLRKKESARWIKLLRLI